MKSIIIIFSAIIFSITACNSGNNKSAHTHEDGTACEENHAAQPGAPEQESFKVEGDSSVVDTVSVKHEHSHEHESGHKCDGHDHKH